MTTVINDIGNEGLARRELYVDARDLALRNPETNVEYSTSVYTRMMTQRGKEKLADRPHVQAFEARIRTFGVRVYTYGEDYFLGDRVTFQDHDLRVQISTEITEALEAWDETGYGVHLVIGNAAPTITELAKRRD